MDNHADERVASAAVDGDASAGHVPAAGAARVVTRLSPRSRSSKGRHAIVTAQHHFLPQFSLPMQGSSAASSAGAIVASAAVDGAASAGHAAGAPRSTYPLATFTPLSLHPSLPQSFLPSQHSAAASMADMSGQFLGELHPFHLFAPITDATPTSVIEQRNQQLALNNTLMHQNAALRMHHNIGQEAARAASSTPSSSAAAAAPRTSKGECEERYSSIREAVDLDSSAL
jgi:hypothetical protein